MRRMTKWMSAVLSFGLCLFVGFTQTAAQAAELPGATVADSGGTTSMREVMAATGSSLVIPGVVLVSLVVVAAIAGGVSLFKRRRGGK